MPSNETAADTVSQSSQELSPEMVRKVADRVYKLLLQEARVENERRRPQSNIRRYGQGGG